jgi:DME family drug/metabolite transporter
VLGLVLALGAGAAYAVYTVGAKHLMNSGHRSDDVMTAAFVLGGLLMLPLLLTQPLAWLATPSGLVMALWLGLATTTLAYVVFGRGLRLLSAGPVTTLVLAEPVVATFLGVVVLGERLPPLAWAGAALVLAGLALQGVVAARGGAASGPARRAEDAVRGEGFPL